MVARLSRIIYKVLNSITLFPESTKDDYLRHTTLSLSAEDAIRKDWERVVKLNSKDVI